MKLDRRLLGILAAALGLLILGAAGGAYAYYFSGLRSAPKPVALQPASSPPASATAAPTAGGTLAGTWTVGSGSTADYRVSEVFAGTASPHVAVAATTGVSGGFTAVKDSTGYQLTNVKVTVDLTRLQSQDTVAGLNVANRDRIVQQALGTSQYPSAVFQADSIEVPAGIAGGPVTISAPGKLTIHGQTRDETFEIQAQPAGAGIQAVGSVSVKMTDFGVNPPALPLTQVQDQATLEFTLQLARG